jgi:penicillin-binding protein 1A
MAFLGYLTTVVLLVTLVGLGYAVYLLRSTMQMLPDTNSLVDYLPGGATEIFATDKDPKTGKQVLLGSVQTEYKEFAPITSIPKTIQDATVAIEDERFYSHRGLDLRGIGRALYRDIRGGKMGEGGSTLTQQLARNIFLNQKKNLRRKIQEAILAIQLEKSYSKEQILEMYMNEVCYGENTFGVKAAAQMYFGKSLKKLTVAESALIAGLPQQPARLTPFGHLDAALNRRDVVLAKMREHNYITAEQYKKALKEKPKLVAEQNRKQSEFKAPYFTNYVLRQLIAKHGRELVYHGGLKVYTTLNYQMQREAERAIANGVLDGRGDGVTQGAIVSVEPRSGYIRAMVGGVDFKKDQFNNITQGKRQPGSSFKPFVYTAAFMANPRKYDPEFGVSDAPVSFPSGGKYWSPKNYDGRFHGYVTIRRALTFSYNIPAVKVANMIGIDRVVDTAELMGFHSLEKPANRKLARNLSTALGAYAVSPLELTSAYAVFPNHGNRAEPLSIIRVVDGGGKVLEQNDPLVEQAVVPESVVSDISSILHDVVNHGTAASAKGIHDVVDAHGKTGTTNDNRDAWFVGYTPELVTTVWVCGVKRVKQKNGKVVVKYPPMSGVTGGRICAPIWARFMKAAVPIQKKAGLPPIPAPEKAVSAKDAEIAKALKEAAGADGTREQVEPSPEATPEPRRRRRRPRHEVFDDTLNAPPTPAPEEASPTADPYLGVPATAAPPPAPAPEPAAERPAPEPRAEVIHRDPIPAAERTASVTICEETGRRASRWCPVTIDRTYSRGRGPRGTCSRHRPLPGDG